MSDTKNFNQSPKGEAIEGNIKALHGLNICTTGFSRIENKLIKSKIENLGGIFLESLLATTHYLIINRINTDKAITAVKYNIKLVTKEWIDENNSDKYLDSKKCTPGCFYGISLYLFGFNEEELENMNKQISQKDGKVFDDPDEANLIIVKSELVYIDKDLENLEKYESKIVTEKWYYSCISKNEYIPIDENQDLLNLNILKNNFEKILTEIITQIESGKNTKYIKLFIGKMFYMQGFKDEIKSKIIKIISFCSGFYFDTILESTNYIIVPLTFGHINEYQNETDFICITQSIVTCNWLLDSIKEGKLLSPELYKPKKPKEPIEPVDPVDKKKILYLSNIFKNESFCICKNTYMEDKIKEIVKKIEQNMGEYFEVGYSIDIDDYIGKYIIINDGYPETSNKFICENVEKNMGKVIISHRFLDLCLMEGKLLEITDSFDSIPYSFGVPLEEFKNRYFYLPPNQFSLQERSCYGHLIKTLGGNFNDLNVKTTHILFKKKIIKQKVRDIMIKSSNENVKFIEEKYFTDFILQSGACDINKYQVKIKFV